jgi:hypothetical protein
MSWQMPSNWLTNSTATEQECLSKFTQYASIRIGLDETFYQSGSLFYIIGMVFG